MVVGIVFCDQSYKIPSNVKKSLKEYDVESLRAINPSPSHGDLIRHGNFVYVVLGDEYLRRNLSVVDTFSILKSIREMLESFGSNLVKSVVAPLDILLGRGVGFDELVTVVGLAFESSDIGVRV